MEAKATKNNPKKNRQASELQNLINQFIREQLSQNRALKKIAKKIEEKKQP